MKIDGNQLGGVTPDVNAPKPGSTAAGLEQAAGSEGARRAARIGYGKGADEATGASGSLATDAVSLSGLSQELRRLASSDTEREARIDSLAAAYESGKLEVDAARVATKLVDDAFFVE